MTENDIPALVAMGRIAHTESSYKSMEYSENRCTDLGYLTLDNPDALLCLVAEKDNEIIGFCMAAIEAAYFSDEKTASDLMFYVLPEHRGSWAFLMLVRAYVQWTKDKGAKLIFLGNTFGDETIDALYLKLGFQRMGGIFRMEV
jgi:GNAT superfamily N-acetyltransferase